MADERKAEVIDLDAYRRFLQLEIDDTEVNALWDELLKEVNAAWEWRDHESLDNIVALIEKIRPFVEIPIDPKRR